MDETCLVPCAVGSCPLGREGPLVCHVVPYALLAMDKQPPPEVYPTILELSFIFCWYFRHWQDWLACEVPSSEKTKGPSLPTSMYHPCVTRLSPEHAVASH